MRYLLCVLCTFVVLVGCSETVAPPSLPNQPPTDPPTTPPTTGACAVTLSQDITVPTTLTNTASACDYLLEGFVEVSSTLIIEPGVVIQATQDASLWIDGGQLLAVGTPQARITLEGVNHISGYWDGIRFTEGRESRIEYVDLKDAGQVCTIQWCPDAALILDNVTISLVNTTVSNSYVHGLVMSEDVLVTRFESNRFYGNVWAGIVTNGNQVPVLDTLSDYTGGAEPNGTPYVLISSGDQTEGREFRWKKLNAPYFIGGYFDVEGGTLILEPGVEIVFDDAGWLTVEGNGVLKAVGTAAAPITFRGAVQQPGYWDGITFWDSPWEDNELSYVRIHHSGSTSKSLNAYGAVRLRYESRVNINNSVLSNNGQYGVACDEPSEYVGSPELVLGLGNTFGNNAAGDVDPECGVTP